MASNPGLFTDWPWKKLGNFKYVLWAPCVASSVHGLMRRREVDIFDLCIIPMQVLRLIHAQLWISYARFQTSKRRIVTKGLEFEQVDRERNWDDNIILTALLVYIASAVLPVSIMPWWDSRGVVLTAALHAGPVEFLYYWFHRALHHHFLYSRYHSHHHASIVTEPITSVIHPFAEEVVYFLLFAIPILTPIIAGNGSVASVFGYMFYIDFMNYLGHCNFELVPKWIFGILPPLKYLMYTPSFHSLHHTQFRTNYSLFMPLYDYIYHTMDKASDDLYKYSLAGKEEPPHVVHLTHPTTLLSIYHLRFGFASLASRPYQSMWFSWLLCPLTCWSLLLTWVCGSAFTTESNRLAKLEMQTWAIPRFSFQYMISRKRQAINALIENAITTAEAKGTKVLSLGLLNQSDELNHYGELYLRKNQKLRVRIVDGSSLATAVVLNLIPRETKQVLFRGRLSKVAFVVVKALCQRDIQVIAIRRAEFEALKLHLPVNISSNLFFSNSFAPKVWLVGHGLTKEEQAKAQNGTHFIPFSQFPPKKARKDCIYHSIPAMVVPKSLENIHACENWLPRRVMSAWRIAGIVHALEGWTEHEIGDIVLDFEEAWHAALKHGFLPLSPAPRRDQTLQYH